MCDQDRDKVTFNLRRLHPRNWSLRVLWDVFMVWLALINLHLIVFDLTYLMLRPYYATYVAFVVRVYDPVKGISPHPLTEEMLDTVSETSRLLELDPRSPGLKDRVGRLRALSMEILQTDPFRRSGQQSTLEVFQRVIREEVAGTEGDLRFGLDWSQAVRDFWSTEPDALEQSLERFDAVVRPMMSRNYFREIDFRGRLVDYFWLIDLPFLSLFLAEFLVRWYLAIRRRTYARWFFFPFFNWYDLLGLIPYTQFRIFRLFRIASIYMRLRRSELSRVGKDTLSRAVAYVSNIIAEEISDVVALRILSDTQEEIRDGTHVRIFNETVLPRRAEIEEVIVSQLREIMADETTHERMRHLLRLNLEMAVESSSALRAIPMPDRVMRPLVRSVGEVVLESVIRTMADTLDREEGRKAAREFVGAILDQVLTGPLRAEIESLASEISDDVIEDMKTAVAVKKWARPTPAPGDDRTED
jgi:hypothetical protein